MWRRPVGSYKEDLSQSLQYSKIFILRMMAVRVTKRGSPSFTSKSLQLLGNQSGWYGGSWVLMVPDTWRDLAASQRPSGMWAFCQPHGCLQEHPDYQEANALLNLPCEPLQHCSFRGSSFPRSLSRLWHNGNPPPQASADELNKPNSCICSLQNSKRKVVTQSPISELTFFLFLSKISFNGINSKSTWIYLN